MSKMGVSTIRSYRGAQIFEAIGLSGEFIESYFPGTPSRIGGIGAAEIARETLARHATAAAKNEAEAPRRSTRAARSISARFPKNTCFPLKRSRSCSVRCGKTIMAFTKNIQRSSMTCIKTSAPSAAFSALKKRMPVPIGEVEPVDSIVKRFVSSAMSFGSISKEAHETIAIAMNRLGAASNSGEGGEDEERYTPLPNGDSKKSAIKQVASARFGVTSNYLVNSRELQIKIAQGAKPGEGGQLPGHKVDATIARVRHSMPGVMLISPPPHHDIYSIEDLAQLIYDLKSANPEARISVKLVAEAGVGTVAAGVAKGTCRHGSHQRPRRRHRRLSALLDKIRRHPLGDRARRDAADAGHERLRDRIRVQVDGQLRTGRDIVIGALLGAEEFGFGTIVLVTLGCVMMRKCHLNTCPVGVATQDPNSGNGLPASLNSS